MIARGPIGVFDSGVGGLSVLRAVRELLPAEDLLYVADSAYIPYGDKPADFVALRAHAVAECLLSQHAKALVVACNTATGAAIAELRARFAGVPIVGMEPALKPAAAHTRSGVVGVLATAGTLASEKFAALLDRFGKEVEVLVQPCPGWVECVEAGDLASAATRQLVERSLEPLLVRGADAVVLGCTHFPFLTPLIRAVVGPAVAIVDPSDAVARELLRRLEATGRRRATGRSGTERGYTSGSPAAVARVASQLWGKPLDMQPLPVRGARATPVSGEAVPADRTAG